MACTYTHDLLKDSIFNSAEGLLSALYIENPLLFGLSHLDFFHADGKQVGTILEGLAEKSKGKEKGTYQGVNSLIRSNYNIKQDRAVINLIDNGDTASPATINAYESYRNFTTTYGILMHSCLDKLAKYGKDSDEYSKALKTFSDFMASEKSKVGKYEWGELIGSATANATVSFILNYSPEVFNQMVINTITLVYNQFKKQHKSPYKLITEMVLDDNTVRNGAGLSGVFDAITYDDDGNVVIWDFKTTNSNILSSLTKLTHYGLLEFYKQMLIKQGIPENKITVRNIQMTYTANPGSMETTVSSIDPDTLVPMSRKGEIATMLQITFPKKGADLSVSDLLARELKLSTITSSLITPLAISKIAEEQLLKSLTTTVANNQQVMLFLLKNDRGYAGDIVSHWSKQPDGSYIGYNDNNQKIIEGTLEEIAKKESLALQTLLNGRTHAIANILRQKSRISLKNLFLRDNERLTAILQALEPYISPEYEYILIDALEEHNIITMLNHMNGHYSFIAVSDLVNLNHFRDSSKNILASIFKDPKLLKEFKEFDELPESSMLNVLTLQTLFAVNMYKDIITNDKMVIDRILVVSSSSGRSTLGCNMLGFETCLKLIDYDAAHHKDGVENAEVFAGTFAKFLENITFASGVQTLQLIIVNRVSTFKFNNPDVSNDTFSSIAVDMTYDNIVDAMNKIKSEFVTEYLNVNSEIGRIYAGLQQLKQTILSGELYNQLYKHTKKGLSIAETLGAGLDLVRYGEARKYSYNGMMMAGIAQSLDFASSYSNPDETVAYYNKMFSRATQMITEELNKLAVPLNIATKKFLSAAGKLGVQASVLGNTNSEYEKLFETDGNKMSDLMLLINPYRSNNLVDYQNEYIEEVLWVFNRLRMPHSVLADNTAKAEKYKKMTYAEFKKSDGFENYKKNVILSPRWRQAPLMLKQGAQGTILGIKGLFRFDDDNSTIALRTKKFFRNVGDHWLTSIEPFLLTPEQKTELDKNIDVKNENFQYHSPYNVQGQHRVELTNAHKAEEWECNLNILALEYACALFKEVYFKQVLESVSDLLGIIKLQEVMTGQDLSNTKETLINRLKISVYNASLIEDEDRGIALATSGVKRLVSYTQIAVRPALFVKEMVLGVIRNVSTIWAKNLINDYPITYLHLMEAAGLVYTNGLFSENAGRLNGETFGDFRLINKLNNIYRINDRDLSVLGESLSYDHSGIMRIGSRMLYANTTSPDWFNRMMLLIAKMKADGTWDAHSVDERGNLVYDSEKDKRFAPFIKWQKAHKNSSAKEPTDEEYITAKALYKLKIEQFKREGYTGLVCNDIDGYSQLPRCYTVLEMDSFKEQVGMIYGYYTHEERANVLKGISWLLHTLFLTFLPAEIRKYLASGNFNSSVGKTVHLIDPISKKKLYYHKNEAGLTEKVTEDKLDKDEAREPVLEFTYTPLEGLLVSTIKTCRDVWKGEFDKDLKPELWDRTKLCLFNTLIAIIVGALLAALSYMGIDAKKANSASAVTLAALDLTKRVGLELNGMNNLLSPIASYGIAGTRFILQAYNSMVSLITSDSYTLLDAANSNFAVIKDFHFSQE